MPVRDGDPVCLYPNDPIQSSQWEIFNLMGESLASLSFPTGQNNCWSTAGVAPGVYIVQMKLTYADGHAAVVKKKIVIVR
jgi:hypothetical protein